MPTTPARPVRSPKPLSAIHFGLAVLGVALSAGPAAATQQSWLDAGELPELRVVAKDQSSEAVSLPLEHTQVDAEIAGFVARVQVTQRFSNPYDAPIEVLYVFPLPEGAAVDAFELKVGERRVVGEIRERKQARREYERARREGHTAGLLEQERPNIFKQSIANIAPGESIEVKTGLVQTLGYDAGEYHFVFPLVVAPRYMPAESGPSPAPPVLPEGRRTGHDVGISLRVAPGLPVEEMLSPSHDVVLSQEPDGRTRVVLSSEDSIPNRDFVLRYRVAGDAPQATLFNEPDAEGRGGTFSLLLQPPQLDLDATVGQRELIFVVDVSGSMSGLPLYLCKEAMLGALRKLRPTDRFNLITFAGRSVRLFEQSRRASEGNLHKARSLVTRMGAGGGTELLNAVKDALSTHRAQPNWNRYVFFLTDGHVGNEREIHEATRRFVRRLDRDAGGTRARVFGFGVGSSPNRHLLDGLAEAGNGLTFLATNREDPMKAVNAFFRVVDHPVITEVELDWGQLPIEVATLAPQVLPDLFASRPVLVHGRYHHGARGTLRVEGRDGDGKRVRLKIPVAFGSRAERHQGMGSLWARARVHERLGARFDGASIKDIEKDVLALGLKYRLMTPYTSFVAIDRSRRVSDGNPQQIEQPAEIPEDVDVGMSGARILNGLGGYGAGFKSKSTLFAPGGLGSMGHGRGGGGLGVGKSMMMKKRRYKTRPRASVRGSVSASSAASDTDMIKRAMRRSQAQVRYVYERALRRDPAISGRLVVEVTLDARGQVAAVKVLEDRSTITDAKFIKDLVRVIRRLRFPAGDAERTVVWPFVFEKG